MNRNSKIAIIGGGIGGLTTAIALRQNGFTNIVIYERRSDAQSAGAGFVIWANGSWVLNKLGLLKDVGAIGGRLKQMQRWSEDGDFLGGIDIAKIDEKIGYPSYAVSKLDFHNLLQNTVIQLEIKLQNNTAVAGIEDNEHGNSFIQLEERAIQADIIIGADGRMNSIARKYVCGDNLPIYQNYINWVGILESDNPLSLENNVLDYWGCGERFGVVPINERKAYWAACKALQLDSRNKEATDKEELLKLFHHWPPFIKTVMEQTQEMNIKRIPVFDQNPIPTWFKNNVCLLGDAAHASLPTSGQGVCQAMEDAWQLASQLTKYETLKESFEAFQNSRLEKTTAITISGRAFSKSLFNRDKDYCLERNRMAKLVDYEKTTDGMVELWSRNLN